MRVELKRILPWSKGEKGKDRKNAVIGNWKRKNQNGGKKETISAK